MPDAQCPMPNAQCPMPNAQCPMPNARRPIPMIDEKPDWIRLQKALLVETERGFINLKGKQYLFNEFLTLT
ncbi:MAG: hypothetical protein WBF90_33395, partial [Rivularia sp. (in: cyanobacteria)]